MGITEPILVGHSDGASIAIIHAATVGRSTVLGCVLIAPHLFVEECTLESARAARVEYESGELQELAIPVIGTGRGRLRRDRKRMSGTIAESFVEGSRDSKISEKLVIVVRPEDAQKFQVNLWDVKDYLDHALAA